MKSLESAAFSFLIPAGCVQEPPERAGLAAFTCEMALRGAGKPRQPAIHCRSGESRRRAGRVGFGQLHQLRRGHAVEERLAGARNLCRPAAAGRSCRPISWKPAGRWWSRKLRAIDDEPAQKVMIELRRRQYPDPWGRSSHGELSALRSIAIDEIRDFQARTYAPNGTILGVAGRIDWSRLKDEVGRLFGDWQPTRLALPRREARSSAARTFAARVESDADRRGLQKRAVSRSRFLPGLGGDRGVVGRNELAAVHRGAREARLVLHGLCHASLAARSSLRLVLCRHQRRTGPGNTRRAVGRVGPAGAGNPGRGAQSPQSPGEKLADHATGIELRRGPRRSRGIGSTWAVSARSPRWGRWSTP